MLNLTSRGQLVSVCQGQWWGFLGTIGAKRMIVCDGLAKPRVRLRYFCLAIALFAAGALSSQARAEDAFNGPSFRKGLWHFVRTLDVIAHRKNKHRVLEREATRCVDPTVAMKATFASPP